MQRERGIPPSTVRLENASATAKYPKAVRTPRTPKSKKQNRRRHPAQLLPNYPLMNNSMRLTLISLLLLSTCGFAQETPLPKVPDGFKVELILQAPDIEAPTALAMASNGDVYFAEDPMDMSGPPTKNIDKIWLLKGGDPKKKTLFADQMWAVMGLEVVRNNLFVVHPPYVTKFTLNKEGLPAAREDLFTDLGPKVAGAPSFNDHVPSGIRMGMDGWLYVSIGDKGIPKMTRKEKDQGSVHAAEGRWRHTNEGNHISLEGGGVIRFRPDGSGLEVFASGTRNHLDVPLDEHDRIFVRDNTDDGLGWNTRLMYLPPGGFMGYPWAYKHRPKEMLPAIHDFGGGSPCGGWVYLDDGLPATYKGRIFHCEWGKQRVYAVRVEPDGGGFKFVDEITFMDPGNIKDFRPFTLRPTADGWGFYVTDWAFNGWLSKTKAGRLWKVTYAKDDVKPAPRGKDSDSVEELIKSLDHPAHTERLRAQRELVGRGKEIASDIMAAIDRKNASANVIIHGLWALRPIDGFEWIEVTKTQLKNETASVRLEAARLLVDLNAKELAYLGNAPDFVRALDDRIDNNESDRHVRAMAVRAIRHVWQGSRAEHTFRNALDEEKDIWVRYAITRAMKWSQVWEEFNKDFKGMSKELPEHQLSVEGIFTALTDEYSKPALEILLNLSKHEDPKIRQGAVEVLARNAKDRPLYAGTWWGTQPARQNPPARTIAWEGTPLIRDALIRALRDDAAEVRQAAVVGLIELKDPESLNAFITQLDAEKNAAARSDLIRAIAALNSPKAIPTLSIELRKSDNTEAARLEIVNALELLKNPEATESLVFTAMKCDNLVVQARAVEALGNLKNKEYLPAIVKGLTNESPLMRKSAVLALGKFADLTSLPRMVPLLSDRDIAVENAAIQAIGGLHTKEAIPFLMLMASREQTQFNAILALTGTPDVKAIPAYLTGLSSKSPELRTACRAAFLTIREPAVKILDELHQRKELPASAVPELRSIYSAFQPIISWYLIGPFPAGKSHPPEKELNFDAAYPGADKEVRWRKDQKSADKLHGMIDLSGMFSPNNDVVVYGYAEIESSVARDTTLLIGSDDTMKVWINDKKVYEFNGNRGWNFDAEKGNVKLEKGKNKILIQCGNASGPWAFSVAYTAEGGKHAFLQGVPEKLDLNSFRDFARKNKGDAVRGRTLFADLKGLACIKCHAVGGQGGSVGPSLDGIALKYGKEELMTSILEPSKTIANGYETIKITLLSGKELIGVFKGETGDSINVANNDGKFISVAKKDIEERKFSPVSTMPNGLNDGMTLQDFADVVAYLEARREEPKKQPSKVP
jgi:putative heme-binding domain-containing protein